MNNEEVCSVQSVGHRDCQALAQRTQDYSTWLVILLGNKQSWGKQTKLRMSSAAGVLWEVGHKVKKQGVWWEGWRQEESTRIPLPLQRPAHGEGETEGSELGGFIKQIKNGPMSSKDKELVTKGM